MENWVQVAINNVNFAAILPSLVLSCFGMFLLLVNAFSPRGKSTHAAWLSIVALVVTGITTVLAWNNPQLGFGGSVALDNFAVFFHIALIFAAGLTILMSDEYIKREGYPVGEYYTLILFATVGGMLMASGTDMMTIFLGLEVMSVSLYVLAGFFRGNLTSNEAGLKYFLLGAFSTGFLLYGIALVYGATGSFNLQEIATYITEHGAVTGNPMLIVGMLLIAVGFLFKIGAAPFHMWAPDVYQGAPTPITAFMSAGPKAAAFAAFLRIFSLSFGGLETEWTQLLWILAVATMTIGNIAAIYQQNLKRMLAYSSISHAGYAMVGMVAANEIAFSGILFYMLAYTFMNVGAFAVLTLAGKKGEENLTIKGFAGFGFKQPFLAVAMCIFLFSLMGLPPTAGFAGKFYVFAGAVKAGYIWLAVIGVLNSAVSLYYYLRVMVSMYFGDEGEDFKWVKLDVAATISIVIAIVGVLYLGLVPGPVMEMAKLSLF